MTLTFHVTKEIFQMYLHNNKLHEYRKNNQYWYSRALNLLYGDPICISEGYSNNLIHLSFVNCKIIKYSELPEYAKKFFKYSEEILDFELSRIRKYRRT